MGRYGDKGCNVVANVIEKMWSSFPVWWAYPCVCGCLFQEVDGKHVQIQLTGFMEKNTGRFMKELWILLTSAQKNLSGIPQEFLDVKAEEQRLKKVAVFVWISHFFIFSVFLSLLAKFCSCKFWIPGAVVFWLQFLGCCYCNNHCRLRMIALCLSFSARESKKRRLSRNGYENWQVQILHLRSYSDFRIVLPRPSWLAGCYGSWSLSCTCVYNHWTCMTVVIVQMAPQNFLHFLGFFLSPVHWYVVRSDCQ